MSSVAPVMATVLYVANLGWYLPGDHIHVSLADLLLLLVLVVYSLSWKSSLKDGSVVSGPWLWANVLFCGVFSVWIWWATVVAWAAVPSAADASLTALFLGVVLLWFACPIAILYAGYRLGRRVGSHRLVVRRLAARIWMVQGAAPIPAIWLGLWALRFLLEDFVLNGFSVFLPVQPYPAGVNLVVFVVTVMIVGTLYLVSIGLMVGVSVAIWNLYRAQRNAPFSTPASSVQPSEV